MKLALSGVWAIRPIRVVVATVAALLAVGGAAPSFAATVTVDCVADPGALAGALAAASDGDTLTVQGTCIGAFEIAHSLTLTGSGSAGLDGAGAIFALRIDPGTTVGLTDLTVSGGAHGISNQGALTLTDSTVSGNTASFIGGAGIFNVGALTLDRSTITGNTTVTGAGGGIFNSFSGSFSISDSTITGNSARQGGGIYDASSGKARTVDASSITGNTADGDGGAIDITGFSSVPFTIDGSTVSGNTAVGAGGGIANVASLSITNSTISGNAVGSGGVSGLGNGGGIFNGGALMVTASTISGNSGLNGGGIFSTPSMSTTIADSILASQTSGADCFVGTPITDGGYNLESGSSCGFSAANHSLPNTNPLLDPAGLQGNGATTQTVALLAGSPAIDAIPPGSGGCGTTLTVDEREVSRPQGPGCDIGAFEFLQPLISVAIDIRPGGVPNPVNLGSNGKIPVAVLSTPTFDALNDVNVPSLRFGRTGSEASLSFCGSPQDVNGDGLLDLVCLFSTQLAGFQLGDTSGVLTGQTRGGTPITGTDAVVIVPPR